MKKWVHDLDEEMYGDKILCMSNVRGRRVKVPHKLPFSFYFSGENSSHGIRVKPIFNPDRMIISKAGNLMLHSDWEYVPGPDDKSISSKDIAEMKEFFRTYLILFAAVWDLKLSDTAVQDYFEGIISLHELVQDFEFYQDWKEELDVINSIGELEDFCREHDLVNLYGN